MSAEYDDTVMVWDGGEWHSSPLVSAIIDYVDSDDDQRGGRDADPSEDSR